VGAKDIISHPQYNNPQLNNDIALIELSQSVKLSQRVNPVCLPSHDSDVPTGSKCYITGGRESPTISIRTFFFFSKCFAPQARMIS